MSGRMAERPIARGRIILFALLGGGALSGAILYYLAHPNSDIAQKVVLALVTIVGSGVLVRAAAELLLAPAAEQPQTLQWVRDNPRSNGRWLRSRRDSAAFFRVPPYLVDFEKHTVVQRNEVTHIRKRLSGRTSCLLIIEGAPASGKTVLLESLKYELTRRRWSNFLTPKRGVYELRLKGLDSTALLDLSKDFKMIRRKAVVLIDDAHLFLTAVGAICQSNARSRCRFVVTTRPLVNYPREQTAGLLNQRPSMYPVHANDVADEIVVSYLRLKLAMSTEAATRAVSLYSQYKHDLWLLSVALEATELVMGDLHISEDRVNTWVLSSSCRAIYNQGKLVDVARVVAPIAALFRYEVPVRRKFLIETLSVSSEDLQYLVLNGDIVTSSDDAYSLHHSSLANIIVAALSTQEGIARVPEEILAVATRYAMTWPDAVVMWQVEASARHAASTLVGVARVGDSGRSLALRIMTQLPDASSTACVDPAATSVETMGSFIELWHSSGRPLTSELSALLPAYVTRAEKNTVAAWAWLVGNLTRLSAEAAVDTGACDILAQLLANEPASVVSDIGTTLSYLSPVVAGHALSQASRATAELLQRESSTPEERAKIFAKLVWVNPDFADDLLGKRLTDVFPDLDASSLAVVISRIAWGNLEVAKSLLRTVPPSQLHRLLTDATDPTIRFRALAVIANVSPVVAHRVVAHGTIPWDKEIGMTHMIDSIIQDDTLSPHITLARIPSVAGEGLLTVGDALSLLSADRKLEALAILVRLPRVSSGAPSESEAGIIAEQLFGRNEPEASAALLRLLNSDEKV